MSPSATAAATIHDQTLIRRNSSLLIAAVHDETVMMNIESGRYYGLDEIGSDIWRRLETPLTFTDLIDRLAADYFAARDLIAEDTRKLLALMAKHEVVTLE